LVLSCGTENAIHAIAELEKCEYQFTGTTPALCLPVEGAKNNGDGDVSKEEL
jgi:protein kinase C substrate 80K-H